MLTIHIVTDIKGAKGAEEKTKVELEQDAPVLRDLISAKTRVEVSEWQTRSRRIFCREWATENDLKFQRGPGEVKILGRWEAPPIDAEREVKKALDAFVKGKYTVWFAEKKINSLDERVPGDRMIKFIRESPLPKL